MRARVLVGEPAGPVRDAIIRVLDDDGRFTTCATASDAAEVVAAALAEVPEMCLLGSELPGGGLAAAWEITARLPATNVVILAGVERDQDLLDAVAIGVSGYLVIDGGVSWLPNALMDVRRGCFALPRRLTHHIADQLRTSAPRRRTLIGSSGRLTSREWEIMHLIAGGRSTREVAERLTLSTTAVRVHIASAVRKLGVRTRSEAIEQFRRADGGLAEPATSASS